MDQIAKKVMTKTVTVNVSKKGNQYLSVIGQDDKKLFVNLVKDNKAYLPKIPKATKEIDVDFTSYKYDDDGKRLVLFDVTNLVFKA